MEQSVRFEILGPIRVLTADGEIRIAGRERVLLAMLLLNANRPVDIVRLVDAIWGEEPPRDARNQLQGCVSRLRKRLAAAGVSGRTVVTDPAGYRLSIDDNAVDLRRFHQHLSEARTAAGGGRLRAAWDSYRAATALWRGPALAGIDSSLVRKAATALDEEHLRTLEECIEIELTLGASGELVPELTDLVAQHPYRESLHGALMVALHRSGRQADALAAYQRVRKMLVEEVGTEPGAKLRELHQAILREEPTSPKSSDSVTVTDRATPEAATETASDAELAPPATGQAVTPWQLPAEIAGFTGRTAYLAQLDTLLEGTSDATAIVITAIAGTAGVGKTALAVHWAHRVADRFPDGQLYVNLRGYAPGAPLTSIEALAGFLYALGVSGEKVPVRVDEAAAAYRSLLSSKRILVVLDNAATVEQVRPLLPAGSGCLAIVTSRDQLGGLVAHEGARWLSLDVLPAGDAYTLLVRVLGANRVAAEPEAARVLARLCGYLPLALRVAAANLVTRPRLRIAEYVANLRDRDPLAALMVAGDPNGGVAAAFEVSYARLPDPARRLFRLLGLVPGPDVTAEAAAALAQVATKRASELLHALARAHLIEEHAAGRYSSHDLLRRYATNRAEHEETQPDREAARHRLLGWYLYAAQAATETLHPEMLRLPAGETPAVDSPPVAFDDPPRAQVWFDAERANLITAITNAAEHGPRPVAWRLAHCLRGYWWRVGHLVDWQTTATAAAAAASREADLYGQSAAQLSLGMLHHPLGRHREADEHFANALELARQAGWVDGQAAALCNGGAIDIRVGRLKRAVEQLTEALALDRKLGRLGGQANTLHNLGEAYRELGQLRQAYRTYTESLALTREVGAPHGTDITTLSNLGVVSRDLGRLDWAYDHVNRALSLCRESGHRNREAYVLDSLAQVHCHAGRSVEALEAAESAVRLAGEIGDRVAEADARNTLGSVHLCLNRAQAALDNHQQALDLARRATQRGSQIDAMLGLAAAQCDLGHHIDARAHASQALDLARQRGYRLREGQALTALAEIHLRQQHHRDAHQHAERALDLHRQTGYRLGEARTYLVLGHIRHQTGDTVTARANWQQAHSLFVDIGTPEANDTAALLA